MFGRYEMIDRIGLGGMAEVWLARVAGVGGFSKAVVIKKILPSFAQNKTFIDMLLAEARLCAVLQHANIVQVYENGEIDGVYFICMEYVAGHDLFKVLSRATQTQQRIPAELCLYIAAEAAKGLHYAHNARDHYGRSLHIIHRDVSPSNIILSESGECKIMDFGVARATPPGGQRENATRSGVLKGKLGYMSPEQVTGRQFDHRSDIFSLGIILYESLTLKRLFLAKTDLETLVNIRDARLEHKFKKHSYIDEDFRNVLRKSLAREPADRYPTALAMHDDIMQVLFDRRQHVSGSALTRFLGELFDPIRAQVLASDEELLAGSTVEPAISRRQFNSPAIGARGGIPSMAQTQPAMPFSELGRRRDDLVEPASLQPANSVANPALSPASKSLTFSPDEARNMRAQVEEKRGRLPAPPAIDGTPLSSPTAKESARKAADAAAAQAAAAQAAAAQAALQSEAEAQLEAAAKLLDARGPRSESVGVAVVLPKRSSELRVTVVEPRGERNDTAPHPLGAAAIAAAERLAKPLVAVGPISAKLPALLASKPSYSVAAPGRRGAPADSGKSDGDEMGYESGAHAPQTDPEGGPPADDDPLAATADAAQGASGARHDSSEVIGAELGQESGSAQEYPLNAGPVAAVASSAANSAHTLQAVSPSAEHRLQQKADEHRITGPQVGSMAVGARNDSSAKHLTVHQQGGGAVTSVDGAQEAPEFAMGSHISGMGAAELSRPPFEVREPTLPPFQIEEPSRPPFQVGEPSRLPFALGESERIPSAPRIVPPEPAQRVVTGKTPAVGAIKSNPRAAEVLADNLRTGYARNPDSDIDGAALHERGTQPTFDGNADQQSYTVAGAARPTDHLVFRVRLSDGTELSPVTSTGLEALLRKGTATLDDFVAVGEGSFQLMRTVTQLAAVASATQDQRKPPTLAGPLSQWIFVRLLYKCASDRSTGILELRRGQVVKLIYFRRGRAQYIASNQHQELLGPFMVANGYVSQADIDMAVAKCKQTGAKLGDLLIALNLIKPFQLYQVLERQMRARFIDAFGWDGGTYGFYDGIEPPSAIVPLDIDPISILAEGVRERVSLAVLEPLFADKLDRRIHKVKNPLINLSSLKLQARESKAVTMLHSAETPRQAYQDCYSNRQQRLALLHVLFLMLHTELITFDPERA